MKEKGKGGKGTDLSNFFFGNVTNEGELDIEDDSFFDKELRDNLSEFTKKGGARHLGVGDLVGDDDVSTTTLPSATSTTEQKDEKAVDFEDIDEVAEEINSIENEINKINADRLAKQAEENIKQMAARLQSTSSSTSTTILKPPMIMGGSMIIKPPPPFISKTSLTSVGKRKVEDDFDFDEDESSTSTTATTKPTSPTITTPPSLSGTTTPPTISTPPITTRVVEDDSSSTSSLSTSTTTTTTTTISPKNRSAKKFKTTINAAMDAVRIILQDQYYYSKDDSEFKAFCSAHTNDGAIFKFSDLFAPKMLTDRPKKRRRVKQLSHLQQPTDDIVDLDEQTIFSKPQQDTTPPSASSTTNTNANLLEITSPALKSTKSAQEKREYNLMLLLLHQQKQQQLQDEENLFEPLQEKVNEEIMQEYYRLPDTAFNNIEQYDWEEKIVWDEVKESSSINQQQKLNNPFSQPSLIENNNPYTSKSIEFNDNLASGLKRKRWGDFEKIETNLLPSRTLFQSNIVGNWSIFPVRNIDLERGDWINDIVWDESSTDYRPKLPHVLLDLNDRDMLFEDHVKKDSNTKSSWTINVGGTNVSVTSSLEDEGKRKSKKKQAAAAAAAAAASSAEALQQQMSALDKFNLSNDKYYRQGINRSRVRQQSGKALVQHSLPAIKLCLTKTHFTLDDLKYHHRPRIHFPPQHNFRIALFQKESQDRGRVRATDPSMKHKIDLSAREGRVIFVEHLEQNPTLLNNVGMGSRIRNFYRRKNSNDAPFLSFDDGENVLLDANDESPFLGDIAPGRTIQALVSNLYKAPIFKHNPSPTDFLLIRSRDGKKWYIREMGTMYTAGQQMPEVEVPAPNSRGANMFVKNRLAAYIHRLFRKKKNVQRRIKIQDVCNAFPSQSETSLRKRLKDCSDLQRGGGDDGWWFLKETYRLPTEEEIQKSVTPELVCTYESMLVGLYHLQENGIIHFTSPGTIPMFTAREANDPNRDRYKLVEDELNRTPWNLTNSFIQAMQGKGKMQLVSDDPSNNETFSYLKMPQKVVNQKQKDLKKQLQKNQVTGTDADLRKLSLKESETVLLQLGVSEEVINSLTRWKRIALVRKKSSEAALAAGTDSNAMTKFARGSRYSLDHQQLQYKEKCQNIFENQMRALQGLSNEEEDDDIDLDDLEDLQKDIEESLSSKKSKSSSKFFGDDDEIDEDEREEYNKLMDEMTNSPKSEITEDNKMAIDQPTTTSTTSTAAQQQIVPLATINESDEDMSSIVSNQVEPHLVEYIKRTTLFQKPDGGLYRRIEIIRDPKLIREYRRKRESLRKSGIVFEEDELKRRKKTLENRLRKLQTSGSTPSATVSVNINTSTSNLNASSGRIGPIAELPTGALTHTPLSTSAQNIQPTGVAKIVYPDQKDSPSPSMLPKIKIPTNIVRSSLENTPSLMDLDSNQSPTLSTSQSIIVRIKKDDIAPISSSQHRRKLSTSSSRGYNGGGKDYSNNNHSDSDDDIMIDSSTLKQSTGRRRTKAGAEVELSNIFEKVIDKLRNMNEFAVFRVKVTSKIEPEYHKIIKNPIDLTTMRDRCRHWEYKSRNQFMDAIRLMVSNCFEYNANRYPHLLPIAENLLVVTEQLLQEHANEIDTLERSIISTGGGGGGSRYGESNPPTPILSNPATPSSPSLHINVESPFFPPVSSSKQEEEDIDIVSISGVSPSTYGHH